MKIFDALKCAEEKLKNANILDYKIDGKLIFFHLFNMSEKDLIINSNIELSEEDFKTYMEYVGKRANHIPIQEIFNEAYFYGEKFKVNSFVLTPRKETEILVENCIEILQHKESGKILDLCTGSGIIGIILKKKFSNMEVCMSDISKDALEIAEENIKLHHVDVNLIESNLFESIKDSFDMIVSNPPYIKRDEISTLSEEVRLYDPMLALDGGEDGLDFYRLIISESKKHLKEGGVIALEIGYDQGDDVKKLLISEGYINIEVKKDYANLDRMIFGIKNTGN